MKKPTRFLIVCLLFFSFLIICPSFTEIQAQSGNTYYVATNGNDSNSGTESSPWRTIQHAVDSVSAGDTICVKQGIYSEKITITSSGNQEDQITIRSYQDEEVEIDASGHDYGIQFDNSSFIKVQGLTIANALEANVFVTGSVNNITINNCDISDSKIGMLVNDQKGANNLVAYTKIHDNNNEGFKAYDGQFSLRANDIYNNGYTGVWMLSVEDNWLLEDNFIHDNGYVDTGGNRINSVYPYCSCSSGQES